MKNYVLLSALVALSACTGEPADAPIYEEHAGEDTTSSSVAIAKSSDEAVGLNALKQAFTIESCGNVAEKLVRAQCTAVETDPTEFSCEYTLIDSGDRTFSTVIAQDGDKYILIDVPEQCIPSALGGSTE